LIFSQVVCEANCNKKGGSEKSKLLVGLRLQLQGSKKWKERAILPVGLGDYDQKEGSFLNLNWMYLGHLFIAQSETPVPPNQPFQLEKTGSI
jgi:hypothetical protein